MVERQVLLRTAAYPTPQVSLAGKRFYRTREAADLLARQYGLSIAVATLDSMVSRGGGPPFHKWGRFRVYAEADLIAWAADRCGEARSSSSEVA